MPVKAPAIGLKDDQMEKIDAVSGSFLCGKKGSILTIFTTKHSLSCFDLYFSNGSRSVFFSG